MPDTMRLPYPDILSCTQCLESVFKMLVIPLQALVGYIHQCPLAFRADVHQRVFMGDSYHGKITLSVAVYCALPSPLRLLGRASCVFIIFSLLIQFFFVYLPYENKH